jgi:hypothetical protein
MREELKPIYLGDAVYAEIDEFNAVVLRTGSHREHEATNEIVLEPSTLENFLLWLKS